ncbi:MAG: hypothetical protein IBX57_00285 [Gammaproteobacteria bacterium]|nr:hypothetical protein [Gammaproteobacteria bacterium]
MVRPVSKEQIEALECKHVNYCKANNGSYDDLLVIKEVIHTKDGRKIPNMVMLKNFKRDFYVTKPGFQKHKDKKEWEEVTKLQKFTTTQNNLLRSIGRALGRPGAKGGLKTLARSPYLYGTDISPATLMKKKYRERYPDAFSENSVAVLDIETDVVHGHGRPIYVTITFKDKAVLAVTKEFIDGDTNFEAKLRKKTDELLGEYMKSRNINLEVLICDTAAEACAKVIARAHEWQPDFLTIWNIDFDIPKIVECLKNGGYDPAEVFSDPIVPPEYRFFKYMQGKSQKVTASGLITPIHPADRWHKAMCPASFMLIDSMCTYKRVRLAGSNDTSYSLDFQLNKHLGVRKLKFEEAKDHEGLAWHVIMQDKYKVEYGVYNLFDCIGVELFDEKVKDLAVTITVLSGISEFYIFDSQPKRLVDQLNVFCEEKGLVVAAASDDMVDDLDKHVVSMRNWIITLPAHLALHNGVKVVREVPDLSTLIFTHVADLDVSSSYPSTQVFLNMSKETTYRELCRIRGVPEEVQRFTGINLTGGPVNAVEIACNIFKAPKFDTLLEEFIKDTENVA